VADKGSHRHDISDAAWEKLEPLLLGRRGICRCPAEDNRRFINSRPVDSSNWRTMAGSTTLLWGWEKHAQAFLPMAGCRRLGKNSSEIYGNG
jgi:hypothetical protein